MPKHAIVMANGIDGEKPPPGLMSSQRHRHAVFDEHARRRKASELQVERGGRKQCRHHAGCARARGVRLVDEDQVIGRARANLRRQCRSAAQRELVGVNARREAVAQPGLEDVP